MAGERVKDTLWNLERRKLALRGMEKGRGAMGPHGQGHSELRSGSGKDKRRWENELVSKRVARWMRDF